MFWLIDYKDYGYISVDRFGVPDNYTLDETVSENDPDVPQIQSCFRMKNDKLYFDKEIYIRRFYWEDFNNLQSIFDKKCIFAGNIFYIINNSDSKIDNDNKLIVGTDTYLFTNSVGSKIRLEEIQKPVGLSSQNGLQWYLHKITIDLEEMNLPRWYYHRPSNVQERETFSDDSKIYKFAPVGSNSIYDQNFELSVDLNHKLKYRSFANDFFNNNDYRFDTKYKHFNNKDVVQTSSSSECAFIKEKIYIGTQIMKHAIDVNRSNTLYDNCTNEHIPNECHTHGSMFDSLPHNNQNMWKPTYYNFGDFILRPIFLAKYLYLLSNIHRDGVTDTKMFGSKVRGSRTVGVVEIRNQFDIITGPNASIPIYDEPQTHWGGDNLNTANLPRNKQQMNRVGRLWQFLLNPIVVTKLINAQTNHTFENIDPPVSLENKINFLKTNPLPYKGTVNSVYDEKNNKITDIAKFWKFIEHIFKDYVDVLIKEELRTMTTDYKYVLLGGKAINITSNTAISEKSFDFDIHMLTNTRYSLDSFLSTLCKKINLKITQRPIRRKFFINILEKFNLIDKKYKTNNYGNEDLFYYGYRKSNSGEYVIYGLFINLHFDSDIFGKRYPSHTCYPVVDIAYESNSLSMHMGIPLTEQQTVIQDGIRVIGFVGQLYKLIKYIDNSGFKRQSNLEKLENLFDYSKYTCQFLSTVDSESYYEDMQYMQDYSVINYDADGVDELADDMEILGTRYNAGESIFDIITALWYGFQKNLAHQLSLCRTNAILYHTPVYPLTEVPISLFPSINGNSSDIKTLVSNTIQYDKQGLLYFYTGNHYLTINIWLQNIYLGIIPNNVPPQSQGAHSNGNYPSVTVNNKTIDSIIDTISNTISTINSACGTRNLLQNSPDDFFVYRCQTLVNIKAPLSRIEDSFNVNTLIRNNTLLYTPNFMSTSYSPDYTYGSFIDNASFILKIKISKLYNKRWVLMDNFSQNPTEKEIVIDKDTILLITDYEYRPYEITTNIPKPIYGNKLVIHATLLDDINDFYNQSQRIDSINELKNNPPPQDEKKVVNLINFTQNKIKTIMGTNTYFFNTGVYLYDVTQKSDSQPLDSKLEQYMAFNSQPVDSKLKQYMAFNSQNNLQYETENNLTYENKKMINVGGFNNLNPDYKKMYKKNKQYFTRLSYHN